MSLFCALGIDSPCQLRNQFTDAAHGRQIRVGGAEVPIPARQAAIAAAVVAIAGLGVAGYAVMRPAPDMFAQCRVDGRPAPIGGPFTLTDETGRKVTDRDVITGPTLLYFGYTFCPDVCPMDNMRNALAVMALEDSGRMVTPVFISVDSGRDTPETLRQFTDVMHPRMIGLTGTPEQVKAASKAYRTFYQIRDPEDEYYLIDHSTQTYLVFPELGFVENFDRDVEAEDMAARVACFVDAWTASQAAKTAPAGQ
ncbi:protein SCO1/2 [Phaeovulum vinaykumarii]|uniref:Protein SCO1/2 n=1 Tax=Phaeovulum vinaykumarii TaxID=407234 RepID=A0A1N7K9H6_9RHOB|nr:protein SCO1/2 [Phaeovulum vinaykumarii]SOB93726.1 protein SCO1/2 [Phaeovulum vinaykumarii]